MAFPSLGRSSKYCGFSFKIIAIASKQSNLIVWLLESCHNSKLAEKQWKAEEKQVDQQLKVKIFWTATIYRFDWYIQQN